MTANKKLSPELQQWMDKGTFLEVAKHKIFYIDEGDRQLPVIILIHGFPSSSYDFFPMWDRLCESHRVICLDMLGFGFSDKPNSRNYKIHKQANLFEQLIDHLKLTDFNILAHDYGVSVAQELISRQLEVRGHGNCLSCAFLNGGLFPETHKALFLQRILLSPIGKWVNLLNGFKMFSRSFSSVFGPNTKPTNKDLELFWELVNYNQGRHLFHTVITYIDDRREHQDRWRYALQTSPIPLALINGSVDPISGKHIVERYTQLNCRLDYLAELSEIGHYPLVEAPDLVSDHYLAFLDQASKT
jgi:pimeloyl-ACP methyl ester carboxylesterase